MPVLIGIDLGTSACKAIAVDETGEVIAKASAEYPSQFPHPGWVEQDPADWWQGTGDAVKASAVTTRPGMIFPAHRGHLTALPRVSINGNWQSLASLEVLLSGVPFVLWNRGRKVVA